MFAAPNPRFRLYGSAADYATVFRRMVVGSWDRGDEIAMLESALQSALRVPYAVCAAKARVGIFLAIRALVRPGQRVILSPYTISDVVNMVVCAGGTPAFADIDEDTCNVDPAHVERLLGADVGAVLVTHLHGLACQLDRLQALCNSAGVPLVEDAAQALGTRFGGKPVGTFGAAGIFSLGMYKNVNALFGGALVTSSQELADRIRSKVRAFPAQEPGYYLSKLAGALVTDVATFPPVFKSVTYPLFRHGYLRGSGVFNKAVMFDLSPELKRSLPESYLRRMTPTQARLALGQLDGVDAGSRQRIAAARLYHDGLRDIPAIRLPPLRSDFSHTYTYFPIQVEKRAQVLHDLVRLGRDIGAQHLRNCADLPCFAEFAGDCPVARRVAERVVLLPTYPRYGLREVERNLAALRHVFAT